MPNKPLKPCRVPGCPGLTTDGSYCEDHQHLVKERRREKKTDAFYSKAAWQDVRTRFRARHPLCAMCAAKGIVKPMDLVDHIVPIKSGGAPYSYDNLQSLCWACHAEKHRQGEGH